MLRSDGLCLLTRRHKKDRLRERDGSSEIYRMNADGTSQTRLTTNTASDIEPDWGVFALYEEPRFYRRSLEQCEYRAGTPASRPNPRKVKTRFTRDW